MTRFQKYSADDCHWNLQSLCLEGRRKWFLKFFKKILFFLKFERVLCKNKFLPLNFRIVIWKMMVCRKNRNTWEARCVCSEFGNLDNHCFRNFKGFYNETSKNSNKEISFDCLWLFEFSQCRSSLTHWSLLNFSRQGRRSKIFRKMDIWKFVLKVFCVVSNVGLLHDCLVVF